MAYCAVSSRRMAAATAPTITTGIGETPETRRASTAAPSRRSLAANSSTLIAMRDNRVRTAGASPAAVPASRSTASIVACVVEPVISVVGGRLARCTRCSAFCKAIAAIPAKPVSSASGLSASSNGPKRHREPEEGRQQNELDREHDAQRGPAAPVR